MTRPSLADITQRADAATEGPREASGSHVATSWTGASDWSGPIDDREPVATASPADAEFIAHARTDVPALSAAIRDVLAECDRIEARADRYPWSHDACTKADVARKVRAAITAHIDTTPKENDR
ncbi:hypothetical protein [Sanguibacter massiliensis]|uniref:hypothetical protein n=1 Tax=Sanguibacter massiliensis TaxID=1973217 RepID=UPI000C8564B8|nr:hypothetical protein [Sanguibacter massiliensis]